MAQLSEIETCHDYADQELRQAINNPPIVICTTDHVIAELTALMVARRIPTPSIVERLARLLQQAFPYPAGDLYLIADILASHTSGPIREWLEAHPRIQHAFIPVGAAWLNLVEGWWRIFRRKAFAGQLLADDHEIAT